MSMRFQQCCKVFVAFAALFVIGCAKSSAEDTVQVFQHEWWAPLAAFFGGIVATLAGYAMLEAVPRLGWVLVAFGPMAVIGLAPSLYRDRVVVSNEGFDVRAGLWGFTGAHSVRFADTKEIRITSETQATRRGRSTTFYFNCDQKVGESIKIPMSGNTKTAAGAIIAAAEARDVPIRSETEG